MKLRDMILPVPRKKANIAASGVGRYVILRDSVLQPQVTEFCQNPKGA